MGDMASITAIDVTQNVPDEEPITCPAHLDGVAYLYGHPLLNSLSPCLHQTIYDALGLNWTQIPLSTVCSATNEYPLRHTRSPPIKTFLASIRSNPKFVGSSVTMPWKVAIMPHLDDLTEDAKQAGACNTIFIRTEPKNGGRSFVGTNTDCIGIREAIRQNELPNTTTTTNTTAGRDDTFRNKPALVIGGGATARTAIYVMRKWLGVSQIYIVNRDHAEIEAILEEDQRRERCGSWAPIIPVSDPAMAASLKSPAVIVSSIPNYPPKTPEELHAREVVRTFLAGPGSGSGSSGDAFKGLILEMCYHPVPWTEIAEMASTSGWKVIMGSEALLWQGIEQARLWTGQDLLAVPGLVEHVKKVVTTVAAKHAAAARSNL